MKKPWYNKNRNTEQKEIFMKIRQARIDDLAAIMEVYAYARGFMKKNGNPSQWKDMYPSMTLIESDIAKKECFVGVDTDGSIRCVFAFIIGNDSTYDYIEDGQWLNEDTYGTIHRIASDGIIKDVFSQCVDFCNERIDNIRIDTHRDNKIMQHQIMKNGFENCGIIYVEDGSERIAYHRIQSKKVI
jgi:hypothetical protein